jgi:2-octaprenyl-6-methoxyphenol hydroxylase
MTAHGTAARERTTGISIALTGAGPVSLACALFLVRRGIAPSRIALDAAGAPPSIPEPLARRSLAISHGSRQLLDRIARFPDHGRIARVEVSMAGHAGRTRIGGEDLGAPALGYVVRYGALLQVLRDAAMRMPWAQGAQHRIADAATDTVIIHADGDPGDDARVREFDQCALLGEVRVPEEPPSRAEVAYERFTDAGPLALLPLPEARRRALVWCDTAEHCEQRRALSPAALAAALQQRFGAALGPLQPEGPLTVVPLIRRVRTRQDSAHEAWIGNAAQVLHPVAGQGLNLGLRDAFELAAALADADRLGMPARQALERFRRQRRTDRGLTVAITDLMARSFTWPFARPLQSPLLAALDLAPALRRPLAAQLMYGWR